MLKLESTPLALGISVALALWTSPGAPQEPSASASAIPQEIMAPSGDVEFISGAELADDPSSAVARFLEDARIQAQATLGAARAADPCPEVGPFSFEWFPIDGRDPSIPFKSLDDAIRRAQWSLIASVVDTSVGLRWGLPGTMLLLRVEEVIRGGSSVPKYLLAFAPVGTLHFGERSICAVDASFPPLPLSGDRVVVLLEFPSLSYGSARLLRGPELVTLPRASKAPLFGAAIGATVPSQLRSEHQLLNHIREQN